MELKLFYEKPAQYWVEALPLGNGRIGAMVYGKTAEETICMNEDTLWSGYPADHNKKNMSSYIEKSQKLALEGNYPEAQKVLQDNITGDYTEAYMPMGDLKIKMPHENAINYKRELNISNAMHKVTYSVGDVCYTRECFASCPQEVFVYKISADKEKSVSCEVSFDSQLKFNASAKGDTIDIEGLCPSHAEPSYLGYSLEDGIKYYDEKEKTGIRFHSVIKVCNKNGEIVADDNKIIVKNSDEVTIYLSARSNYLAFDKHPEFAGKKYIEPAIKDIENALKLNYCDLTKIHQEDYKKYYDRVYLNIGENKNENIAMDKRLEKFKETQDDEFLPVYLFQYGRYLMISSSRKGTQAANLQGIWSDSLVPPWSSNYTLNINLQMNYWCVFMANLAEFNEPLVDYIKDLSIAGVATAKEYYNASGFVAHHNSDIWKLANPVGYARPTTVRHAYWNLGAAWLCEHLFEQYEYTLDEKFLKETAYPIMKKSAEFLADILIETDGYLAIVPSTSPENGFVINGKTYAVAKTTTMTMSITRELFENCVKSCEILGIDEEFKEKLEALLPKLYPFQIGKDGRLLEWSEELVEEDREHRHISHLYGLHPSRLITPDETPELAKACEKVLDVKALTGTGWSLSWKINQWARLNKGEKALRMIKKQLTLVDDFDNKVVMRAGGSYPNLFDAHPPFQIDGNFGVCSGIAEMLLQSYGKKIVILPALPSEWAKGEVRGLRAKNTATADIIWENNELKEVSFKFEIPSNVEIYYKGELIKLDENGKFINKI